MRLEVDRVSVFYGVAQALEDVSLEVSDKEIVSIIGSNGAGKSTLIKTICGLQPPRKGRILLDEKEINGFQPYKIARMGLIVVPEGRQAFLPLTVRENLEMGSIAGHGFGGTKQLKQSLEEVFDLFPILRKRQTQQGRTLSGGEQQMLVIGRALMSAPRLLLLDEPSLGLAPMMVELTFSTLVKLHKSGIGLLLVEQNAFEALQLADRGYVLENGKVVMENSGEKLIQEEDIRKAYLGG